MIIFVYIPARNLLHYSENQPFRITGQKDNQTEALEVSFHKNLKSNILLHQYVHPVLLQCTHKNHLPQLSLSQSERNSERNRQRTDHIARTYKFHDWPSIQLLQIKRKGLFEAPIHLTLSNQILQSSQSTNTGKDLINSTSFFYSLIKPSILLV